MSVGAHGMGRTGLIAASAVEHWRYRPDRPLTSTGVTGLDMVVVTLSAADGTTGTGFGLTFAPDDAALTAARALLERFVDGTVFDHPIPLWRTIAASFRRTGRGPYASALAAIDIAAWDLYAKTLGVPLGVAMGGVPRRAPVFRTWGFKPQQPPDEAAAIAEAFLRGGARGVKIRVDGTLHDRVVLQAVAERLNGAIDLMADANQRPTPTGAARLLQFAADAGCRFVEEPLPASNLDGFAALARTTPVPIATGQNLRSSVEAATYVRNGWCSVIQPDFSCMGGLSECLRVAQFAEHANVEVSPHYLPALFVQLAGVVPNLTWLDDFRTIEVLLVDPPTIEADGMMTPPNVPGHGLVLSDEARKTYRIG
jgi:L-alanine-DL-glutamate epimerase-like enolase superfamily enzyme